MDEIWQPIPGFENCGEVSNLGRIRSFAGLIRKTVIANNGYIRVGLKKLGKDNTNYVTVHRLVAMAFVDGYAPGLQVNHKDCNKENNAAVNLEWVSAKNNVRHAYRSGRRVNTHRKPKIPHEHRGELLSMAAAGTTEKELAGIYGVCQSSMHNYLYGRKRKTVIYDAA